MSIYFAIGDDDYKKIILVNSQVNYASSVERLIFLSSRLWYTYTIEQLGIGTYLLDLTDMH